MVQRLDQGVKAPAVPQEIAGIPQITSMRRRKAEAVSS